MIDDKNFLKILLYAKILIGPESVSENFQTRIQTRTRSGPGRVRVRVRPDGLYWPPSGFGRILSCIKDLLL